MADKWPLANGVWSNAANWNGGTKPVAGDDVFADGRTITIDEDVTVASIRTTQRSGGTAGGGFILNAGITVTANVIGGSSTCITRNAAGADSFLFGNVTAPNTNGAGVINSSSGTVHIVGNVLAGGQLGSDGVRLGSNGNMTITGNVTGGTANNGRGALCQGTGSMTVTGNVFGGIATDCDGIRVQANGLLIVNGNVLGGGSNVTSAPSEGIKNEANGVVTINGNVTGGNGTAGWGARNVALGTLVINGNAIGGLASAGAVNGSTGTMRVFGLAIGNDQGLGHATNVGAPGVAGFATNSGTNQATTTVRGIKYGAKGQSPTSGLVQLEVDNLSQSFASFRGEPNTFTEFIFGPPEFIGGQPSEADVRENTVYNFGLRTGTLIVPDRQYVNAGVLVDNTVGTLEVDLAPILAAIQSIDVDFGPILDRLPETGRAASAEQVTDAANAVTDRGDEAWTTAVAYGDWVIRRSFQAVDGFVVGVQMSLVGVSGKVAFSDANGEASIGVVNGTYTVRYSVPIFFEAVPDEEITINDADDIAVNPIVLVRRTLPPLADGLLCLCTVAAINQHGDPAVSVAVTAETKNGGAADDQIFVFNEERAYWTDERGQVSFPLLRGHRYAINIAFADFGDRTVLRTIPDQSTFLILVRQ